MNSIAYAAKKKIKICEITIELIRLLIAMKKVEAINLNLIEDILDIIKKDNRHNVKICIDMLGVTIYLDDDPEDTYEEKYVIPVMYDSLCNSCYIPHDKYIKCMSNDMDTGIDREEIDLISKLMAYLEDHKEAIDKYLETLSRSSRIQNS